MLINVITLCCLVLSLGKIDAQMHLIASYRIPSLTNEKCALSMNSKHIDYLLTSMIAYFGSFQKTLDGTFAFDDDIEFVKYDPAVFDSTEAFRMKTPLLLKRTYQKGQSECFGMGGSLPEPNTELEMKVLAKLLSDYSLQFTLVDVELEDMSLVYPSGKSLTWSIPVRLRRELLELTIGSDTVTTSTTTTTTSTVSTTAKYQVSAYNDKIKGALHGINPVTREIVIIDKTKSKENGKTVCLINRLIYM